MELYFVIALAACAVLLDYLKQRLTPLAYWEEDENMPQALRAMSLFNSEFKVKWRGIKGVIDQAYIDLSGRLVLLDTKTRQDNVVKSDDILQLSLYRVLLMGSKNVQISTQGYVRVVYYPFNTPDMKVQYHSVRLFSTEEVCRRYGLPSPT